MQAKIIVLWLTEEGEKMIAVHRAKTLEDSEIAVEHQRRAQQ